MTRVLEKLYDVILPIHRKYALIQPGELVTIMEYWYEVERYTMELVMKNIRYISRRIAGLSKAERERTRHTTSKDYGTFLWVVAMSLGFIPRVAVLSPTGDPTRGLQDVQDVGVTPMLGDQLRLTALNDIPNLIMSYLVHAFAKAKTTHSKMVARNGGVFPTDKLDEMQTHAFQRAWGHSCLGHLQLWETVIGGENVPHAPRWVIQRVAALRGVATGIKKGQENMLELEAMRRREITLTKEYEKEMETVRRELQAARGQLREASGQYTTINRELRDVQSLLDNCIGGEVPVAPPVAKQLETARREVADVRNAAQEQREMTSAALEGLVDLAGSVADSRRSVDAAVQRTTLTFADQLREGKGKLKGVSVQVRDPEVPGGDGTLADVLEAAIAARRKDIQREEEEEEGEGNGSEWDPFSFSNGNSTEVANSDEEAAWKQYKLMEKTMAYERTSSNEPVVGRRRRRRKNGQK